MTSEKVQEFKKSFMNYVDIALAIINALIIMLPLIFFSKNIVISILGIVLSCSSLIVTIFTFSRNNPLYIYYCYVLLIGAILFLIPSIVINPIFGILFIPEVWFIYNISKGKSQTSALSSYAKMQYLQRFGAQYGMDAKQLTQQWDNINPELDLKEKQQRELLEQKYYGKKILISSFLLSLSLIAVFALYTITFFSI